MAEKKNVGGNMHGVGRSSSPLVDMSRGEGIL